MNLMFGFEETEGLQLKSNLFLTTDIQTNNKQMKIAIIGTGNLGKSIAKGLITTNAITTLYLTKRNLDPLKNLKVIKMLS